LLYDRNDSFERDTVDESAPGWRLSEHALPRLPEPPPPPAAPSAPIAEGVDAGVVYDEL
jgi:hypothetical protein